MILLDLINLQKIRRAILYLLCAAVTLWLQTAVFSRVALPGVWNGGGGVKPFFVPAIVTAIGLWEGGVWGGVFGLLAGLYCDLNMTASTVTFLILFTFCGFVSGMLAEFLVNRRFVAYLLLTALALLFTAVCQIVPMWIFRGAALDMLLPVALMQAAWSLPFAVPAYFAVKAISGRNRME